MAALVRASHREPSTSIPEHPFYTLPMELILEIVDLLPADSFISFTFANYPLLLGNGLAPALSRERVAHIVHQTRISRHFQLLPFPAELTLQVLGLLKPLDVMRFVMANYEDLERQGIAPSLSMETVRQLRLYVCRGLT